MVGTKTSKILHRVGKGDTALKRIRSLIRALTCTAAIGLVAAPIQASALSQASSQLNPGAAAVHSVESVGVTVSNMDRSVEFYGRILSFGKISDIELAGNEYEHLEGVFGLRMRVVRMQLGAEFIELMEYLAPKGRPVPPDS